MRQERPVTLERIGLPNIVSGTSEFEKVKADYFRDSEYNNPYPGQLGGTLGIDDHIPQINFYRYSGENMRQTLIFLLSKLNTNTNSENNSE